MSRKNKTYRAKHSPRRALSSYWRYGWVLLWVVVLYCSVDSLRHWVMKPTTFPVRSVHLYGDLHYVSQDSVQQVLASASTAGMLAVNLGDVRRRVEALPWVLSCAVRREWPATLSLDIQESHPVARWGDAAVLGSDGLLHPLSSVSHDDALPWFRVYSQAKPKRVLAQYHEAETQLAAIDRSVKEMNISPSGAVRVRLDNGWQVVLGQSQFSQRLQRLIDVYPELVKNPSQSLASIDLQYTNGFAVRWK